MKKYAPFFLIFALAVFGVASVVVGYDGPAPKVVVEGDMYLDEATEANLGGFWSPGISGTQLTMETWAPTATTSSLALRSTDSGKVYLLSATGTTITLPALEEGLYFKFVVNGSLDTDNVVIDSSEGDNINGTLSVNNADVACSGEDQINIVIDGETLGDYVELYSDGSKWLIGDSGVETAAKMTCTDPS